jgi:hypothetical protein
VWRRYSTTIWMSRQIGQSKIHLSMNVTAPGASLQIPQDILKRCRSPSHRQNFRVFSNRSVHTDRNSRDVKTIQGLLRHAKASTTLDLYSQVIDASKLAAQRDIALAITTCQAQGD